MNAAETIPSIKIAENDAEFAALAAALLVEKLDGVENPLLVLPTGNTPLGMYRALLDHYGGRRDLWARVRFLALDEYAGLRPGDERLFQGWLGRVFLDPVGIAPDRRMVFNSAAPDPAAETARMENWVKQNGPIDLAVLGLGGNGHIAFNEPGTPFEQPTHLVRLTPDSIAANAQYWGGADQVPGTAYTLGLGTIAGARQTILLVSGAHKAGILHRVLNGAITPDVPATFLRRQENVTIIADRKSFPEN